MTYLSFFYLYANFEHMKTLKICISILLFFTGIKCLVDRSQIAGIAFMILSLLVFPLISDKLPRLIPILNKKIARYVVYLSLLVIAGATLNVTPVNEVKKPREKAHKIFKVTHFPKQSIDDSEFWREYDPEVKVRIYNLINSKDCAGLQREFNIADSNMDMKLKRTGRGNTELMSFINDKMRELDCY